MKPSRNLNALVAETDTPTQTLKAIIEANKEMDNILERLRQALYIEYMSLLEKENEDGAEQGT